MPRPRQACRHRRGGGRPLAEGARLRVLHGLGRLGDSLLSALSLSLSSSGHDCKFWSGRVGWFLSNCSFAMADRWSATRSSRMGSGTRRERTNNKINSQKEIPGTPVFTNDFLLVLTSLRGISAGCAHTTLSAGDLTHRGAVGSATRIGITNCAIRLCHAA